MIEDQTGRVDNVQRCKWVERVAPCLKPVLAAVTRPAITETPTINRAKKSSVDQTASRDYSYRRLSTGSSFAARAAGTVPNRIPTMEETTIATMAESPEIGKR
jgi:hypothetical protein